MEQFDRSLEKGNNL